MIAKALMFQGTGSDVGKSLLVAGLCRLASKQGIRVQPFKPQNMSNNAAVTVDQGEIGRAQALQAIACGIDPTIHMNPILLKPESETGSQIIVQGQFYGRATAREYQALKPKLIPFVLDSFDRLRRKADLVLVEGAGSPAEINLRKDDIANMGFAIAADVPVVLIGDIDRGGIIASIVGTKAVLSSIDKAKIQGFIINKFRGDVSLFSGGVSEIERRTGWNGFGVVPWFDDARKLPAEDAMGLKNMTSLKKDGVTIAVPVLSRIANFDDLDPIRMEPSVNLVMVEPGDIIPIDADLILIPGTKSTIGDLIFLRKQGWDIDIASHVRRGGRVMGLCGGYQLMGKKISDPEGIEGLPATINGLGLLDIETVLTSKKSLERVIGMDTVFDKVINGYEIHIGRTKGPDCSRPILNISSNDGCIRTDGASSSDGRITGSYVHGIFSSDDFRRAFLCSLGMVQSNSVNFNHEVDVTLDRLATHLNKYIDVKCLFELAR
jgi:adenosylcobyric acid synthase